MKFLPVVSEAPALAASHITAALATSTLGSGRLAERVLPMVCPQAPPNAQVHVDTLTGYLLWGVGILFGLGVITSIGAVVAGRIVNMPHASKAGLVGLAVIGIAIIAYFAVPAIVEAMMGSGCS